MFVNGRSMHDLKNDFYELKKIYYDIIRLSKTFYKVFHKMESDYIKAITEGAENGKKDEGQDTSRRG